MTKQQLRSYNLKVRKEADRIKAQKTQLPVQKITITIHWVRSRTWGSNPNASATVDYKNGSRTTATGFRASGCGYDKESTVIAEIFNRFLGYKLFRRVRKTQKTYRDNGNSFTMSYPYGISIRKYKKSLSNAGIPIPPCEYRSFEGGVGTDCYYDIAKAIGGKFTHDANTNCCDVFTYTDKGRK